ncbi:hypothetical protein [Rhizobium sp. Root1220]|uniref:SGNH/GDSL hydrolase family protein n=1 Tax=Rhizobium sp. Root1220 TaxID=1736432 RepID=UPI0006F7552F|nr:hypothetical protein [Rhizobium sp. Root1220]KQV83776.1 hypothetical protein ASC90_19115 [Rhizobium sp. Root1220]
MLVGLNVSPIQSASRQNRGPRSIVAFGDSLTTGAGASSPDHAYPAIASLLFDPPRKIVNRGTGGQTSTQIAARQGGVLLRLAVQGQHPRNLFPHTRDWMHEFDTGTINGLTHQLVQTGLDDTGLPYGDIRIHGTATAPYTDIGRQIYGSIAGNYQVEPQSSWSVRGEAQLIGGSTNGVLGFHLLLIQADESGGYINEIASPLFQLEGSRNAVYGTGTAVHSFIRSTFLLNVVSGSAVDITLRIFPGQFEAGPEPTPLELTPGDSLIPAYHPSFSRTYGFDSSEEGWTPRVQDGHSTPVRAEGGSLIVQNDDAGILHGCELALAAIPEGKFIRVAFDLAFISGSAAVHVGGAQSPGGSWATTTMDGNPTWIASRGGRYEMVFVSGNSDFGNATCGAIAFASSGSVVTWSLDNVVIEWSDESPQVPVTYRSVDVLYDSGSHMGTIFGTLSGLEGTIATDADGNWTFTRSTPGDGVAVPYGSIFTPDARISPRGDIQWIWVGRNNADSPETVIGDIAAMTARLIAGRYLVGSILPAAGDSPQLIQSILEINQALATLYAEHYVDLHAALLSSGNSTLEDQQDTAAGLVPRSLRYDGIHLNDQGYALVASRWRAATLAMGW